MKQEEKDEWIAALRSGNYDQGIHYLNYGGKFCCLGVKCELDVKAGRYGLTKENPDNPTYFYYAQPDGVTFGGVLTNAYCEAIGLSDQAMNDLMGMNDGCENDLHEHSNRTHTGHHSFAEIAQWIEDNVPVTA